MAKKKFSYPRVRLPRNVSVGRGCVRSAADDFPGARIAFMASSSDAVRALCEAAFADAHSGAAWIFKPAGEPTSEAVAEGAARLGAADPELIVAIGGGSVLDWSRLAWAQSSGALDPDAPERGLSADAPAPPPFILIPTTCATGAESATVAVLSREGSKIPVVSDAFLAHHVFLDPQFLEPLSPGVTALFLCDALSHAIEAWASIVPNRIAKELAVSALRLIREGFVPDPDYAARENLMLGAFFGGAAASHCSVGSAHAFAHTAAAFGIGHAHGNAMALVPAIERLDAAGKLDALASAGGFGSVTGLRDFVGTVVDEGLATVSSAPLAAALGDAARFEDFTATMKKDVCMRSSPLRLSDEDLRGFIRDIVPLG